MGCLMDWQVSHSDCKPIPQPLAFLFAVLGWVDLQDPEKKHDHQQEFSPWWETKGAEHR